MPKTRKKEIEPEHRPKGWVQKLVGRRRIFKAMSSALELHFYLAPLIVKTGRNLMYFGAGYGIVQGFMFMLVGFIIESKSFTIDKLALTHAMQIMLLGFATLLLGYLYSIVLAGDRALQSWKKYRAKSLRATTINNYYGRKK